MTCGSPALVKCPSPHALNLFYTMLALCSPALFRTSLQPCSPLYAVFPSSLLFEVSFANGHMNLRLCSFPAVYLSLPPLFHIFVWMGHHGSVFPCLLSLQLPHFSFFCILTFYGGAFYTFFHLFFLSLHLLFPQLSWGCVGITSTG